MRRLLGRHSISACKEVVAFFLISGKYRACADTPLRTYITSGVLAALFACLPSLPSYESSYATFEGSHGDLEAEVTSPEAFSEELWRRNVVTYVGACCGTDPRDGQPAVTGAWRGVRQVLRNRPRIECA